MQKSVIQAGFTLILGLNLLAPFNLAWAATPLSGGIRQDEFALTDDLATAEAWAKNKPDDPEAHFLLGIAYSRTPALEKALQELKTARKLAKKTPEGYGLFDRKIAEYEHMLAKDPSNPQILYRLGFGYYFRGYGVEHGYIQDTQNTPQVFYQKAEQTLRRLIGIVPTDTAAHNYLGFFLIEQDENKNLDEAISLWQASIKADAQNPGAEMLLGEAYLKKGQLKKALEHSAKALQARNAWLEDQQP